MKSRFLALSLTCLLAGSASAADPQLLKLLMPDARVVSGFDVSRIKLTPFGQFFLAQLPAGDAGFNQFITVTGFDPRRDIQEVLMASPGDPQKKSGLLVVRGNFDSARVLALLKTHGKAVETYHGVSVIAGDGPGQVVAFLDNSVVVAGDLESVRGAIDRRSGAVGIGAELAARINRSSVSQDAWVVSMAPLSAFAKAIPDRNVQGALQGDLLKTIEQSSGGVRFGSVIEITGEVTARTSQDATSLGDVFKFFLNMAQLNAPAGQPAQFVALLKNLTVNTEANAVKLSVSIPQVELETLIKQNSGRRTARTPRI